MSKRVSHSLLDPYFAPWVPRIYRRLHIPRSFPPEGIVLLGHGIAILGAVGFAFSARVWWGGLLVALGCAGNHLADMVDGTHARTTGQCRNGGELLDHFTDPLSFAYWVIGLGMAAQSWPWACAGIIVIYATAVLTNIKAKLIGEFTLGRLGPTEMKALFGIYGLASTGLFVFGSGNLSPRTFASWFLIGFVSLGILQLIIGLVQSVHEVNSRGAAADETPWEFRGPGDQDSK